jgi:surface protein
MFRDARELNQPLNKWDVSNVTDMESMFMNAQKFNQPLNNWDVSNVHTMHRMFMTQYHLISLCMIGMLKVSKLCDPLRNHFLS